jgi:FdrA protein
MNTDKIISLFNSELVVVSVGSPAFANAIENQGFKTIQVDWIPPAGGDKQMQELLKIMGGLN